MGFADKLTVLFAVEEDLRTRLLQLRSDVSNTDMVKDLHCSDNITTKLLKKFPEDPGFKGKEDGYDQFTKNAPDLIEAWEPMYSLIGNLAEFRFEGLRLISEMSKDIIKLSLELNPQAVAQYYNFALAYAKLHLLLGACLNDQGKAILAAFGQSYRSARHAEPRGFKQVAEYVTDFEKPLAKLQDDLNNAQLRVAEALTPLHMQLVKLSDAAYLRGEGVLSPVFAPASLGKSGRCSAMAASEKTKRGSVGGAAGGAAGGVEEREELARGRRREADPTAVDPLLLRLPELKQWVVYGFLLNPEELAQPGAIELLFSVLNTMYVLPVLGEDVLWPHTEFDADNKRVAAWIKKKDEVKKFQNAVKESRLAAWKQAGGAHLALRTSLCTKLSHLESFLTDSPQLLFTRMPQLLCALRLARDEVAWWAAHADAVPEELPKALKNDADFTTFNTATVQTLLRYMMSLRHLVAAETSRLAEEAAETLQDASRMRLEDKLTDAAAGVAACPTHVGKILRDLPVHLSMANKVGYSLEGYRLNVLRVSMDMAGPGTFQTLMSNAPLFELLKEAQAAADLSVAVDVAAPTFKRATEVSTLLASVDKFGNRLFMGALYSKPADCIALLQLAASGGARLKVMENCLKQLQQRLAYLLDALVRHLSARRSGLQRVPDAPADFPSLQAATQMLCALCAALDRAPPLEFPRARLSIREWLREHLELALQREVARLMFSADGTELNTPVVALARLHDLTTALAMLRNFVNVDVHNVFNHVIAREFGTFQNLAVDPAQPDEPTDRVSLVRSQGLSVKTADASACAVRAQVTREKGGQPPPLLIDRLKSWLRRAVQEAQAPEGPRYMPGRRGFAPAPAGAGGPAPKPSPLDAQQFHALAEIIGTAGCNRLNEMLLEMAAGHAAALRRVLVLNKDALIEFARYFANEHAMLPDMTLSDMEEGLGQCHALGVVLQVRKLLLEGVEAAKKQLLPQSVMSFVKGLGEQQLPDGRRAGQFLQPVANILSDYGVPGGIQQDALLQQVLHDQCGVSEQPQLWSTLPYMLALTFTLPKWASVKPDLSQDTITGNLHCMALAVHALLSMVENHDPRLKQQQEGEAPAIRPCHSHRRFMEVSSLVLLHLRQSLESRSAQVDQQVERSLAAMVMLVEQLVSHADPLNFGDLQPYLPHALVTATYSHNWRLMAEALGIGERIDDPSDPMSSMSAADLPGGM